MPQARSERGRVVGVPRSITARPWLARAVAIALLFVLWEGLVRFAGLPTLILPSPAAVAAAYAEHGAAMVPHVRYTTWELVCGWTAGTTIGVGVALLMSVSNRLRAALYPIVIGIRVVPIIVFAPLLLLAFGTSFLTRALVAITLVFFPITIATLEGLLATPDEQLALARSVGASRFRTIVDVRIPNALPSVFAGLKIATPMALQGVILAEFIASSRGVGYKLLETANSFQTPLLFAYVGVLVAMGLLLFSLVSLAEWRLSHGESASLSDGLDVGSTATGDVTVSVVAVGGASLAVLVAWQIAAVAGEHAVLFIPRPIDVGSTIFESLELFVTAGYRTLSKFVTGWTIGVVVGVGLGTVVAFVDGVGDVVSPYLIGLRAVPDVAIVPLLLVWLRISFESAVVLIVLASFFPITIGTAAGLASLPREHRDLLRSVDAPAWSVLVVRGRHALPSLFAGLKLATVSGLAATVVAEWFVAQRGLGVLVLQGMTDYVPALTYAATSALFVLGAGLFLAVSGIQRLVSW